MFILWNKDIIIIIIIISELILGARTSKTGSVGKKHKEVNTLEPSCKPKKKFTGSYTEVNPLSINQSHWWFTKKISNCNSQKRTFLVCRVFFSILNSEEKSFKNKRYNDGHNNLVKKKQKN